MFIADQIFEIPTQPSSRVLEIANVHDIILLVKQDDDDSDREISEDEIDCPGKSTLSSNIEDDDLDNQLEVLHRDQACRDKTIRTTRVPLRMKRSCAATVIARTSVPNWRHPAGAIAPPLLKCHKSNTNILRESDVIPAQALPLPNADGDENVPQPMAGGDRNVPHHHRAIVEVAKHFIEAIVFPKTPWPIISNEKDAMVDDTWKLTIEAQDCQRALAGAPVGTPSVCQLPGGPSHEIDSQTRQAVSIYSVFCSSIGLMMITPEIYIVKT